MSTDDIDDKDVFRLAADHFADREFDPEQLSDVWEVLDDQAMPATEIAERTDLSQRDLAAFLDWCTEQGLIETGRTTDGERVYARYSYQLERIHSRVDHTADAMQTSLGNFATMFGYTLVAGAAVVAVLALVGGLGASGPASRLAPVIASAAIVLSLGVVALCIVTLATAGGTTLFTAAERLLDWLRGE